MDKVTRIGKFLVMQPIGSGGTSTVYQCREDGSDAIYALKVGKENINMEYKENKDDIDAMVHMEEWRAYKAMNFGKGDANKHGIPEVFETGIAELPGKDLRPYLVMQLLGKNLDSQVRKREWTKSRVFELVHSMINTLKHFHSKGFVHRDIKPSNFCFGIKGEKMNVLYIMDLGFAWPAPTAIEKRRVDFMGTPDYSSSDALRGRRQSYKDDMESLGYTLLEMWLGDLPWFLTAGPSAQGGWTNQTLTRMANKRERKVKALIKDGVIPSFVAAWISKCKSMSMIDKPDYNYFHRLVSGAEAQYSRENKNKRKNHSSSSQSKYKDEEISANKRICQSEE